VAIVNEPGSFVGSFAGVVDAVPGPRVEVLLEEFVPGRELTAAVFLGRRLPLLRTRPRSSTTHRTGC
jgi:hypothetical protein